jgi:hypothetical protein
VLEETNPKVMIVQVQRSVENLLSVLQVKMPYSMKDFEEVDLRGTKETYEMRISLERREGWVELTIREGLSLIAQVPDLLPPGKAIQLGRSIRFTPRPDGYPSRYPHPALLQREADDTLFLHAVCRLPRADVSVLIPCRAP